MLGHKQWQGGKGDRNRISDKAKFEENFDRIFGEKKKPVDDKPVKEVKKYPATWMV